MRALALERLRRERCEDSDRIELARGERRRRRPGLEVHDRHVLLGHAGRLQPQQQQEVIDDPGLDADLLALEVGDGADLPGGDDLVVARRVVVDEHDHLVGAGRDRADGVVQRLAVGVELPARERVDRVEVPLEPDQFDVDAGLFEDARVLGHLPGEPAGPGAESQLDRCARAGRGVAARSSHPDRGRQDDRRYQSHPVPHLVPLHPASGHKKAQEVSTSRAFVPPCTHDMPQAVLSDQTLARPVGRRGGTLATDVHARAELFREGYATVNIQFPRGACVRGLRHARDHSKTMTPRPFSPRSSAANASLISSSA